MESKRILAVYRRALLKVISIANLWVYLGCDQCCFSWSLLWWFLRVPVCLLQSGIPGNLQWVSVAASKGIVGRGWVKEVGWKGYAVSDEGCLILWWLSCQGVTFFWYLDISKYWDSYNATLTGINTVSLSLFECQTLSMPKLRNFHLSDSQQQSCCWGIHINKLNSFLRPFQRKPPISQNLIPTKWRGPAIYGITTSFRGCAYWCFLSFLFTVGDVLMYRLWSSLGIRVLLMINTGLSCLVISKTWHG